MKKFLSYTEMVDILDNKIPSLKKQNYDEIVAVVRGGLTAAHYIAKQLRLPVGVFYPANDSEQKARLILAKKESKRLLIVEDLVAKGRTFNELNKFMSHTDYDWNFMPVLVDGEYDHEFELQGMKTTDWIVFPYEKYDKMHEGDRGLFRMKSDAYGVNKNV